ncbi:MAG TPA: SRPBCC domain-containing protein [bacterium]|nr:SRPBCC domain-containing protein [bacterium]
MTQAKGRTIRQTVAFAAAPKRVYALLMDSKLHAAVTGEAATVSTKVDGRSTTYSGYAEAKNRVLVPGQRIVQDWRASDWPEGHWSVAEWVFAPVGKAGCKMTFVQRDVPESEADDIADGWVEFYWKKMKAYLAKQAKAAKPAAKKKAAKPKAKKK